LQLRLPPERSYLSRISVKRLRVAKEKITAYFTLPSRLNFSAILDLKKLPIIFVKNFQQIGKVGVMRVGSNEDG
jgi:hypothetical protein